MNEIVAGNYIGDSLQIDVSCGTIHRLFINFHVVSIFVHMKCNFHQLELMSLQFLHQKPRFTAWGFFPIDMTFVYAVRKLLIFYFPCDSFFINVFFVNLGLFTSYYVFGYSHAI